MSDPLYEVIFYGQIHEDAELNEVKARIGKMFKADEVTIARLFSGKRIVVKRNLSAEAADKYSIAFAQVGAICELAFMPEDSAAPEPGAGEAPSKGAAADGDASGKRRFIKIAAISAIAVVVAAGLGAAALYLAGFFE